MPNGTYIQRSYDNVARLTNTVMLLDQQRDVINSGNQRTRHIRDGGNYVDYTYDDSGQLKTATGYESGGGARLHEKFGYEYDAAGNLKTRTNNALIQTFSRNSLNQITSMGRSGTLTVAGSSSSTASSVTVNTLAATRYGDKTFAKDGFSLADGTNSFTAVAQDSSGRSDATTNMVYLPASLSQAYDLNGNLTSDGRRAFEYDDENQLTRITVTNGWKSEFAYDGANRRRIRKEYSWINSAWVQISEVRYVYDNRLVVQERDGNNLPLVTYTRGIDLGGGLESAGGIGGLLARTDHATGSPAFYHCDGMGNVTAMFNGFQALVAKYLYDPFGNLLSQSGPLAEANLYRFSSKEAHMNSGLYYFGRRFYEPGFQRWLNRDPIDEDGGVNLYSYLYNYPINAYDPYGTHVVVCLPPDATWAPVVVGQVPPNDVIFVQCGAEPKAECPDDKFKSQWPKVERAGRLIPYVLARKIVCTEARRNVGQIVSTHMVKEYSRTIKRISGSTTNRWRHARRGA